MVSAFASQLQAIAQKSTNELDLKARRNAHADSLLFERDVAVKQDFDTLYKICREGYRELCRLDDRFLDFERNLFSEQAKTQDREQMSKAENEALDQVLSRCLMLLASKALLKPAVQALEWLVRRFKIHVHNTPDLLYTLLPYHEAPIWANALSIAPSDKITGQWKFVRPYLKTTWNLPRHAVAHAASNSDSFFTHFNAYVLEVCQQGLAYPVLMRYWSSIVVEALSHRLTQTRSGRKEVQAQRTQDLLHKVLPLLSDGFEVVGSVDLITTCYTISLILAAKADLADNVLDSLLLAVAQSLLQVDHDVVAAVITMSVVASQKEDTVVQRKVLDILCKIESLSTVFRTAADQHDCYGFISQLIISAVRHIKRKTAHSYVIFVERLLQLLVESSTSGFLPDALRHIVEKTIALETDAENEPSVRPQLISLLQRLNRSEVFSSAIQEAEKDSPDNLARLEGLLGMTLTLPERFIEPNDVDMLTEEASVDIPEMSNALGDLDVLTPHYASCFTNTAAALYSPLAAAFLESYRNPLLLSRLKDHTVWSNSEDSILLWQTFLLRFAASTAPPHARTRALHLLVDLVNADQAHGVAWILPYALVLLTDPSKSVRAQTADLIRSLHNTASVSPQNSSAGIYDPTSSSALLMNEQLEPIIKDLFLANLEECVLDRSYISTTIKDILVAKKKQEVRKSHVQSSFGLLVQHAIYSPLVWLKVGIVSMMDGVEKIGSKSKVKALNPILQNWVTLPDSEALKLAGEAGTKVEDVDRVMAQLIDLHNEQTLVATVSSLTASSRGSLIQAAFDQVRYKWEKCEADQKTPIALELYQMVFDNNQAFASAAQETVRSIELDLQSLAFILQTSIADTSDIRPPVSKRRKRSSSATATSRTEALRTIDQAATKIGLALELVESNHPAAKPELLNPMFEMLAALRTLQSSNIESPYLLNLCLDCIHPMLETAAESSASIDHSGIKPELVTDCLRNSSNPQVQNTSLLVLSALSAVVPDRMVHNVMPVFTFIGRNMLSKDDDHSVNVINGAIDRILPALLNNLRQGRNFQSYQVSLATMLSSFTAAYDHIPQHRRVAFYQKLLTCIDIQESGYMLLVLLFDQHRSSEGFSKPMQELVSTLSPGLQLLMYRQLLYLAADVLLPTPKQAAIIFNIGRSTTSAEKEQYSRSSLAAAIAIVSSPSLATSISRLPKLDATSVTELHSEMQTAFQMTLNTIRTIGDSQISEMAKQALDLFLTLPTLPDLLDIVIPRMDDLEEEVLRPQALRVLSLQIKRKSSRTQRTQQAVLNLLPKLSQYVTGPSPKQLLLAALACFDDVVSAFGRRISDNIAEVAQSVCEKISTTQQDSQITTAGLLALAGVFETIKEASVPLVPSVLALVQTVLSDQSQTATVPMSTWGAVCSLMASTFSYASFVISEAEVSDILALLMRSRETMGVDTVDTDFQMVTRTLATKVDLDILVAVLKTVCAREDNKGAATCASSSLSILSQALDSSPKSTVVKQSDATSDFLLVTLDQYATRLSSKTGLPDDAVMNELKNTTIKFIYKLNDTAFRPIFESWIDWATVNSTVNSTSFRQIALFTLLVHFFETLKAIVTSYATYLLTPIASILSTPTSIPLPLLSTTLTLLRTLATHDQDSFFAAPSHFTPIVTPLVSLLALATTKSTRPLIASHIIPAITALATATIDSPTTHTTISSLLTKYKTHDSAHARLASIQTLLAMTEDEDLGDEFVSNVVGIGAGEGEGARGGGGSVGEIMVYVNEMLEDDDEAVESAVRRWVQLVRSKVGEDVFEV